MNFLILRTLTHSELGMFHEYRRQGKEGSKQRAVNFDWDVVDRVFPAAKDTDRIEMDLKYETDEGLKEKRHWLKRQDKNWRLEGNAPRDSCYHFVNPGCLFVMEVDAGTSPAIGSWAVFPKDHTLTRSILADGESGRLASAAMIALHGEEGRRVRAKLAAARPDLFTACPDPFAAAPPTSPAGTSLPPNPKRLVRILASVGHTLPSAVADIVDNSISAHATRVDITFGRPDEGKGRWMAIADNGDGMALEKLREAMRIGSEADYDGNSLGKYGYGMKGASWSQTDVFTVFSKTSGGRLQWLSWDTNAMDDWTPKSHPLEPWEQQAAAIGEAGTIVLWKQMRPPRTMSAVRDLDPHTAEVGELERHLTLVFHRFLEGTAVGRRRLTMTINGRPLEANNPFGHPLTRGYDPKEFDVPLPDGRGSSKVKAKAYLLPHEDELARFHRGDVPGAADRAWQKIGLGRANDTQGLFIYRNDRLIKFGGWHDMWKTNDEKKKLARVAVDFGTMLDDPFAINISKQIVHLPQYLQTELKKLAEAARSDSERKYRRTAPLQSPASRRAGNAGDPVPQAPMALPGMGIVPLAPVHVPLAVDGGVPMITPPVPPPSGDSNAARHCALPNGVASGKRIAVLPVVTSKFAWKVTSSLTGAKEVQVSGVEPSLSALLAHLSKDQIALAHLTEFLGKLESLDVQKLLLSGEGA
jgi:hypothetical protein